MDFKPDRNTLVLNYAITFGIVGLIIFLSTRPGKFAEYYYSPEFISHSSYGVASCTNCHVGAFSSVDEKNCSVSGCHSSFTPEQTSSPARRALTQNEFGKPRPQFGPLLIFHDKMQGKISCEACHPSHRLPQKGKFNHATILTSMQAEGGIPDDPTVRARKQTDIFHRNAEQLLGKVSCQTCHADTFGKTPEIAGAGAASPALQTWAQSTGSVPVSPGATHTATSSSDRPVNSAPGAKSEDVVTTSGHLKAGDINKWAVLHTPIPAATGAPSAATENSFGATATNLFQAADRHPSISGSGTKATPRTDDGAQEMPN